MEHELRAQKNKYKELLDRMLNLQTIYENLKQKVFPNNYSVDMQLPTPKMKSKKKSKQLNKTIDAGSYSNLQSDVSSLER